MTDTRRAFLRLGGAALTGALASTAGCLEDDSDAATPDGDGSGDGGTATATATPEPTATATPTDTATATPEPTPNADYTRWLPAPAAIEEEGGYAFLSMAPKALVEREAALGDGAVSDFETEYPLRGIDTYGDVAAVHRVGRSTSVLVGGVDSATVADALRDRGFSEAGEREGFTLYDTDGARAAALRDDVLVTAGPYSSSDTTSKRPVVEAIVDAEAGAADRYADVSPDCDRLVDGLGEGHLLQGRTHEAGATFDGAVGEGFALRVGREETLATAAVVFADGETDADAVSEWASDADVFYGEEPTTAADGRTVTAAATVPSGDVSSFRSTFPGPDLARERAPQVAFQFEYESETDEAGLLTVTHYGGDHVAADELRVSGGDFADVEGADQTEPGPWQGTASGDDGDAVAAGDEVVLGVASDYEITMVWQGDGGSAELARDTGPDA